VVEFVDDWTLQVSVQPPAPSERHARIEFDAYLRVWEAMKGVWVPKTRSEQNRRFDERPVVRTDANLVPIVLPVGPRNAIASNLELTRVVELSVGASLTPCCSLIYRERA
jgi:hypothetical protein